MTTCPYCSYDKVPAGAEVCPRCNLSLTYKGQVTTRALNPLEDDAGTPRWGTAGFGGKNNLVLTVQNFNTSFVFDAEQITELTMGRVDPDTGESPAIDLKDCDAINKGVSRRHAVILQRDAGTLTLMDQESDNGTFLNGQRLIAHQPRILRDGDEIRLGFLVLYVRFEKSKSASPGR